MPRMNRPPDPLDSSGPDPFADHEARRAAAPPAWPPRLLGWALLCLATSAGVWLLAPQQLGVSLYKLSLVALAAVVGYWLDRSLFPYARPDELLARCTAGADPGWRLAFGAAMLRRAVLVSAAMLAMGLGA